jgi:hypothetical protein
MFAWACDLTGLETVLLRETPKSQIEIDGFQGEAPPDRFDACFEHTTPSHAHQCDYATVMVVTETELLRMALCNLHLQSLEERMI